MEGKLQKGYQMEEVLRLYFVRSGHYTVRGVPFVYRGFDVTDIDIWAYDRPSPVSRQRIIIDCKNKKTPQAIERIFWTKGLQSVLGVEQAIVATTDKRIEVADFGREHGIVILDGNFLARLEKSSENLDDRLTEEEFIALFSSYSPVKEGGDWKARVKAAKIPFASNLGYNAINGWISEAHFFAEQVQLVSTHDEVACRVVYLLLSFIAVALDFVLKDHTFSEAQIRFKNVDDGLRHGSPGASSTKQVLNLAMGLIEHYVPESRAVAVKVRERLTKDLDNLSTRMLAEYVCKPSVSQELFNIAKELESAAYKKQFIAPHSLNAGSKAFFALFIDFWNMDRTKLLNKLGQAIPTLSSKTDQGITANVMTDSDVASASAQEKVQSPSDSRVQSEDKLRETKEEQSVLPGMGNRSA